MRVLKDLSIGKKLYLSFGLMMAIMVFFAVFRGQQLSTVMERYNYAISTVNARQRKVAGMVTTINALRFDDVARALDLYGNVSHSESTLHIDRQVYFDKFLDYLASYRGLILADSILSEADKAEHIRIVEHIRHVFLTQYVATSEAIHAPCDGDDFEACEHAISLNVYTGEYLSTQIWLIRDKNFQFSEYVTLTMAYYDNVDHRMFNIATVLGFAVAISLAVFLSRSIKRPILTLKKNVDLFTAGADVHIALGTKDEVGELSNQIATMVTSISKMLEKEISQRHHIEQQQVYEERIKIALEEALAATVAKSRFIANTSHEIRTPMNSIIGYAELALDDKLPDRTRNYIEKIALNANWLLTIINSVLDLSKMESGNLEMDSIAFNMDELVENCLNLINSQASTRALDLKVETNFPGDKLFVGDVTKINQICINLLSNAIKFTNQGHIHFSIVAQHVGDSNCVIRFQVKDTGIGMTDAQINKIFAPFVQADASVTREYGGTGLGLAIVKNFVDLMGGYLHVNSTPGAGSTFYADIPLGVLAIAPGDSFKMEKMERPWFNDTEVLVAEDNDMNQGVIYAHLCKVGIIPVIVNNGYEAVRSVANRIQKGQKPYDLIFMDIHMPIMDGLKATMQIKNMGAGSPIVAMSASPVGENGKTLADYALDGSLDKPFTTNQLYTTLLAYLTPSEKVDDIEDIAEEEDYENTLLRKFYQVNRNLYAQIIEASTIGDWTLYRRLLHSLKSNAAHIKEATLRQLAEDLERGVSTGIPDGAKLEDLGMELERIIQKLATMFEGEEEVVKEQPKLIDKAEALAVAPLLERCLRDRNMDALEYAGQFQGYPRANVLMEQVSGLDFEEALETLGEMVAEIGASD